VEGSSSDLICGALPEFGMKRICRKKEKNLKPASFEIFHSDVTENSCFWDDAAPVGTWTAMFVSNMSP